MTAAWFSSAIDFGLAEDVPLSETTLMATATHQSSPQLTLSFGLGAIAGGSIGEPSADVGTGVLTVAGATYLLVSETSRRPFVIGGLSLGAARTTAISDDGDGHPLTAFDLRASVSIGKSLGGVMTYAAARAFAGPVSWTVGGEDVTGGDVHHYAVGGGLAVRFAGRAHLAAEVLPLGERSATAGVGLGF